ncbi:polymer-forming cytoskeletal protein [Nonomuraea sp. NPDC049709]|uniref:polymer-forming cytoskeletal protein n=1 Tax=Nonomuraea sp. NPDC049709 TaxID=3154736 RepID=UPI00341889B6
MRTPPHLPARTRHERADHVRRHPYGPHDVPAQAAPRGTLDFPDAAQPAPADLHADVHGDVHADVHGDVHGDVFVEQRLLGIREMSNQAIGSIDDLLQHTP